jgi:hypothetical protein
MKFIDQQFNRLTETQFDMLFRHFVHVFENRVLATHQSKFVQFAIFYVTCKETRYGELFSNKLLNTFLDHSVPLVRRQSAVMYLASYLGRANFLSIDYIKETLTVLLDWANAYVYHSGCDTTSVWRNKPVANSAPAAAGPTGVRERETGESRHSKQSAAAGAARHVDGGYIAGRGAKRRRADSRTRPINDGTERQRGRGDSESPSAVAGEDSEVFPESNSNTWGTSNLSEDRRQAMNSLYSAPTASPLWGQAEVLAAVTAVETPARLATPDPSGTLHAACHAAVHGPSAEGTAVHEHERPIEQASALARHETFYYCVQALCYIVCFHGSEMATHQRSTAELRDQWERILTSSLQPLRYCLHSVRFEFLRLIHHVGMIDEECWAVFPQDLLTVNVKPDTPLSQTRKGSKPVYENAGQEAYASTAHSGAHTTQAGGINPLDSFFPFDPCLLKNCHQYISKHYRTWTDTYGIEDTYSHYEDMEEFDQHSNAYSEEESLTSASHSHAPSPLRASFGHKTVVGVDPMGDMGDDCFPGESLVRSVAHSGRGHPRSRSQSRSFSHLDSHSHSQAQAQAQGFTSLSASPEHSYASDTDNDLGLQGTHRRPRQYSVTSTGSF